jgi:BMFP domain-containing protein YqiC
VITNQRSRMAKLEQRLNMLEAKPDEQVRRQRDYYTEQIGALNEQIAELEERLVREPAERERQVAEAMQEDLLKRDEQV